MFVVNVEGEPAQVFEHLREALDYAAVRGAEVASLPVDVWGWLLVTERRSR